MNISSHINLAQIKHNFLVDYNPQNRVQAGDAFELYACWRSAITCAFCCDFEIKILAIN